MSEPWFLLFDGQSPDGRGDSRYIGRTLDEKAAFAHSKKCFMNPYSTGYVLKITDEYCERLRT